jgi:hypothetical protein
MKIEEIIMRIKRLFHCLVIAFAAMVVSFPSHSAMVGTAQVQSNQPGFDPGSITTQRAWIREQLVVGGVEAADASMRVAALTDAQVTQIHQRINEAPAGGNTLVIIILLVIIAELMGYTDIFPRWP